MGLIKGILAHVRQFRRSIDTRSRTRYQLPDDTEIEHTIINRGTEFRNVRCAVCSYLAQEEKKVCAHEIGQNEKLDGRLCGVRIQFVEHMRVENIKTMFIDYH